MRTTWTFHTAGELVFGRGAAAQLGRRLASSGAKRVLVVTDAHLIQAGLVDRIRSALSDAGVACEVFAGGRAEPSLAVADEAVAAGRVCRPDWLVGLGGGSNLDLAKVVALILAHGGTPADYVGEDRVPGPVLPLAAVPTTAGTGSEVSAAAVLTDTERQLKVGLMSNHLRPRLALVDPLLTVSCPPRVTADSGIDALTHAIEALTAVDFQQFPLPAEKVSVYQGRFPLADLAAREAVRLVGRHLATAVHEPENLEAREGMALAATLAGMAFSNAGVAAVHALEYPVGAAVHCSHGAGNGLLLPYVMQFNQAVRQRELAEIASLLGADVAGLEPEAAAQAAIEAVRRLRREIGIPDRLRELGVRVEQLRTFAEKAGSIERILRVNPRPATVDDLEAIYRAAF